jgi:hypothetical protein
MSQQPWGQMSVDTYSTPNNSTPNNSTPNNSTPNNSTPNNSTPNKKVRVQVDLSASEATMLHHLADRLSVRSRADLLQQAYGVFLWVINELLAGRRVISVTPETLRTIDKCKELSVPAVEPLLFNHYDHLVARPETGYKQLYLKGRNMRVRQLM